MQAKEMKKADFTLDLRGESCPYPVMYTLEALEGMREGELLQVITDCPSSFRNVPEEAVKHGYTFAKDPVKNGQEYLFYIYA
ncbi:sulfurtransferase-like selenium metabolism protein YedF [Virgibacillus halophilus]|uniref:Sulfurtransferase-like selenium metabolism protein YedF n=1 Tax=Tigheibacillus halophilus TaxID=361280 RepID=A0ABU5C2E0_9BACI|nr:sulfurtransferase-like selenium metabolism protein YedF [Virgibacillus halophilus]